MVATLSLRYCYGIIFSCTFALNFLYIPVSALNIGAQNTGVAISVIGYMDQNVIASYPCFEMRPSFTLTVTDLTQPNITSRTLLHHDHVWDVTLFYVGSRTPNNPSHFSGPGTSHSKECSRQCESSFCSVPPLLRYGKYCGLLYSGCPGERPCDGLDACCMKHDQCVQFKNNDYLSQECSQTFIDCMNKFKDTNAPTFKGNTCQVDDVIEVIHVVMEAALLAGRVFHKP